MTTLHQRRLTEESLLELVATTPVGAELTDDHRRSLGARFRAVGDLERRRLDAWSVERAGRVSGPFNWSPTTARRIIGNGALRRVAASPDVALLDAVRDEVNDHLLRCAAGYARRGSLAQWLASSSPSVLAVVVSESLNWAAQLVDVLTPLGPGCHVAPHDTYFDVATARTTLRARRDAVVTTVGGPCVIRVRTGAPGKSAGPGLRADLTIEALAAMADHSPGRCIGVWPDAGVLLAVDATMDDLRAGARDLVRTAVAQRRHRLVRAA